MNERHVPEDVVVRDQALSEEAETSQYLLDRHRWEQCSDPKGPLFTQRTYAAAVGKTQATISSSVRAWAAALKTQNAIDRSSINRRKKGNGQRNQSEAVEQVNAAIEDGALLEQPTPDAHSRARTSVSAGANLTTVIAAMAKAFGVTQVTVADTKPDWPARRKDVLARATSKAADGMAWDKACAEAATELAREVDIQKEQTRARKEAAADRDRRPTPATHILNAVITTTNAFDRELSKIPGLDTITWDDDTRGLLDRELDRLQAIVDRVRLLPLNEAITTADLDGLR